MTDSFSYQIHSKYYYANILVSIEEIELENFSTPYPTIPMLAPGTLSHHAMFCSFLSDVIKQDYSTTVTHSKKLPNC